MSHATKETKAPVETRAQWHPTGRECLAAMLAAVEQAQESVRLEMYIIEDGPITRKFLTATVAAQKRGVKVRVLADAYGSSALKEEFWAPLVAAGGEFRWFNPLTTTRIGLRDHRKILVVDGQISFLGGLNLATEYDGDGVNTGWRDLGLEVDGDLSPALAKEFDEMFQLADFRHKPFTWLRRAVRERAVRTEWATLLLSAPGWHRNPMIQMLETDFARAKKIQIMCAYFLPTLRLRRALKRAARRGCEIELILPAKSDVPLMQMATHGLYSRMLRRGIKIYEYEPQVLHAKLFVVDETVVYVGSANLDVRSMHLNYELLVRVKHPAMAQAASAMFAGDLKHCRQVLLPEWLKVRTWWGRLKSRVAHALLAGLDPYLAMWQIKRLRQGDKVL